MSKRIIDPATGVVVSVSDERAEVLGWPPADQRPAPVRRRPRKKTG